MENPFELLGVVASSTDEEVRRAYLSLSRKCHPDMYPNREVQFRELRDAYEAIDTTPKRRRLAASGGVSMRLGRQDAVQAFFKKMLRV